VFLFTKRSCACASQSLTGVTGSVIAMDVLLFVYMVRGWMGVCPAVASLRRLIQSTIQSRIRAFPVSDCLCIEADSITVELEARPDRSWRIACTCAAAAWGQCNAPAASDVTGSRFISSGRVATPSTYVRTLRGTGRRVARAYRQKLDSARTPVQGSGRYNARDDGARASSGGARDDL
jgi:hypothetical protein